MDARALALALALPLTARAATLIQARILPAAPPGVQLAASGRDVVSRAFSTGALSPACDLLRHLRMGAAAEARGHELAENLGFPAGGRFLAVGCPAATHAPRPYTDWLATVLGFPTAALPPTATGDIGMAEDAGIQPCLRRRISVVCRAYALGTPHPLHRPRLKPVVSPLIS
jgi:hypothetical protein